MYRVSHESAMPVVRLPTSTTTPFDSVMVLQFTSHWDKAGRVVNGSSLFQTIARLALDYPGVDEIVLYLRDIPPVTAIRAACPMRRLFGFEKGFLHVHGI